MLNAPLQRVAGPFSSGGGVSRRKLWGWGILVAFLILACLLLVAQRTAIWHWYLSPAVYYAVGNNDADKTLALLKKGADPNYEGAGGLAGGTPLIWAASQGHIATMRVLISNGADVNRRTSGGVSALDCARINGKMAAVELLLNSGASR